MMPTAASTTELSLTPRAVARTLAAVAALVVAASTLALFVTHQMGSNPHDVRLAQFFYVDGERNIPTAFSTLLLLTASLLLAVITRLEQRSGQRFVGHWAVLSAGFALMAVDEAWSFHEKLNGPMRALLGHNELGVYYYAWVLPAIVLVAALTLFFLRFLLQLPARTRLAFVVAAFFFVGGAVGIELLEGRFDEVHGDRNLVSGLMATVQETGEMAGVIIFIWALLRYLGDRHGDLRLRLAAAPVAEAAPQRPVVSPVEASPI